MMAILPILFPLIASLGILISPAWCITQGTENEKRRNRKKFLLFFISTTLISAIICTGLWFGGCQKMYYHEVWNNKLVKIVYEEEWTTHETRTETYTTTDSKGNTKTRTETIHYTETHGPYWTATDDQGREHSVRSKLYNKWKGEWSNERKIGRHRGSSAGLDRSISGDILEIHWPNTFDSICPYATIHRYKNKVRVSESVLRPKKPTPELMEKYPHPVSKGNTGPYSPYDGGKVPGKDILLLERVNAYLGARMEIHTLLVVLPKDSPRSTAQEILSAWQGPNKNELITIVALEGSTVKWCEVVSWMDDTTLHPILRDKIMESPFSIRRYADLLMDLVPKYWHRKEFADFEYINVSIHWGWMLSAVILTYTVLIGTYLVVDKNVQ